MRLEQRFSPRVEADYESAISRVRNTSTVISTRDHCHPTTNAHVLRLSSRNDQAVGCSKKWLYGDFVARFICCFETDFLLEIAVLGFAKLD